MRKLKVHYNARKIRECDSGPACKPHSHRLPTTTNPEEVTCLTCRRMIMTTLNHRIPGLAVRNALRYMWA